MAFLIFLLLAYVFVPPVFWVSLVVLAVVNVLDMLEWILSEAE